ncbi:hypothetical protein PUN28_013656 [Cardiocondyla obscurior]|uniref:Uncharacterized protein n=1 Tax=Cardiocondyla obscurior TaxID=286306 RepID=A0AAW2F2D7_9HYME
MVLFIWRRSLIPCFPRLNESIRSVGKIFHNIIIIFYFSIKMRLCGKADEIREIVIKKSIRLVKRDKIIAAMCTNQIAIEFKILHRKHNTVLQEGWDNFVSLRTFDGYRASRSARVSKMGGCGDAGVEIVKHSALCDNLPRLKLYTYIRTGIRKNFQFPRALSLILHCAVNKILFKQRRAQVRRHEDTF